MKNLRIYISCLGLSLAAILAVSSCDDGRLDHTIVKGIVRDAGTGTPLENATVYLLEKEWSLQWGGGISYIADSFTTSSSGSYEFQFSDKDNYQHYVTADKNDYWELSSPAFVISYQENINDIHLYPYAWLNIHVKNVNPFDRNDNIRYGAYWQSINSVQDNIGTNIDIVEQNPVKGNRFIKILWNVTKNNISTPYEDSIYCTGGDTTHYEIFY